MDFFSSPKLVNGKVHRGVEWGVSWLLIACSADSSHTTPEPQQYSSGSHLCHFLPAKLHPCLCLVLWTHFNGTTHFSATPPTETAAARRNDAFCISTERGDASGKQGKSASSELPSCTSIFPERKEAWQGQPGIVFWYLGWTPTKKKILW